MDFNIPQDIADYLNVLDAFIDAEIKPLIIAANGRERTLRMAVFRARNGKSCYAKPSAALTRPGISGLLCRPNMAGRTVRTLPWP